MLDSRSAAAAAAQAPSSGAVVRNSTCNGIQRVPTRLYAVSNRKGNSTSHTKNSSAVPKELVLRTVPGIGKVYGEKLVAQGIRSVDELADTILQQLSAASAQAAFTPAVKYLQGLGIKRQDHAQRIVKHITAKFDRDLHSRLQEFEGLTPGSEDVALPPLTLCVEGNISAGKSTFLSYITNNNEELQQQLGVVPEPVEEWQRVATKDGNTLNLLDEFYANPQKNAYAFQSYVFMSRVMQEANSANMEQSVRLMERSVFSDRMVFVRAVQESGWMGDVELAVYDSWFGPILRSNPSLVPDGFIYLKCQPSTCMERLKMRARSEETAVSMDYLDSLHSKHEDWLGAGPGFMELGSTARNYRPRTRKEQRRNTGLISLPSGLVLPDKVSPRLQNSLYYLDNERSARDMHPVLNTVPALVLDCNQDVLRDLDLQREVQQTLAEYITFMRKRREFLRINKHALLGKASDGAGSSSGGRGRGRERSSSDVRMSHHRAQPGSPEGVQQEATEMVQAATRHTELQLVPTSSGELQVSVTERGGVSGNLEALHAAVHTGSGSGSGSSTNGSTSPSTGTRVAVGAGFA